MTACQHARQYQQPHRLMESRRLREISTHNPWRLMAARSARVRGHAKAPMPSGSAPGALTSEHRRLPPHDKFDHVLVVCLHHKQDGCQLHEVFHGDVDTDRRLNCEVLQQFLETQ